VNVGYPRRSQRDRVLENKAKNRGLREVYWEVRCVVVLTKRVTIVEGRTLGKYDLSRGNVMELTESPMITEMKLKRIAELSAANREMVFMQVIILEESLQACFHKLDGKKATGRDGIKGCISF
jgi:hypothetical protein